MIRPITRNLVTVGNAAGVTIPKELLGAFGLELGDRVIIQIQGIERKDGTTQRIEMPIVANSKDAPASNWTPEMVEVESEDGVSVYYINRRNKLFEEAIQCR